MKDEVIRTALIGYGFAGKTFHAPLIRSVAGLELCAVASSDADKVAHDIPDIWIEADYRKVIVRDDVDLVVIATPNDTHASLARAALEAGKHVVVDKPFTVTADEARALADIASRQARVLSVFQNRRWDSDFLTLQAVVREQRLGQIMHFESRIDRFRLEVRNRWREQNVPGGDLLYEQGPHLIDQVLQLFGLPRHIFASTARQRPDALVDDWFHLVMEFEELRAILHCGMLAAAATRRFDVHGTRGSWVKYGMDSQEDALRAGKTPISETDWGHDPSPGVFYDTHGQIHSYPSVSGDYTAYYRTLRDAILGRAPVPVPPVQGIAVMAVLEAAERSAVSGKAESIVLNDVERLGYAKEIRLLATELQ